MKPFVIIFFIIVLVSCQPNNKQSGLLPEVKEVELGKIDPELFAEEEWYMPYYLKQDIQTLILGHRPEIDSNRSICRKSQLSTQAFPC